MGNKKKEDEPILTTHISNKEIEVAHILSSLALSPREVKRLSTYKDMAYRSLRFLYLHPNIGPKKLCSWLDAWLQWMEAERRAREESR